MAARHFKISDDFFGAIGDAILLLDDFRDMAQYLIDVAESEVMPEAQEIWVNNKSRITLIAGKLGDFLTPRRRTDQLSVVFDVLSLLGQYKEAIREFQSSATTDARKLFFTARLVRLDGTLQSLKALELELSSH